MIIDNTTTTITTNNNNDDKTTTINNKTTTFTPLSSGAVGMLRQNCPYWKTLLNISVLALCSDMHIIAENFSNATLPTASPVRNFPFEVTCTTLSISSVSILIIIYI
ncbi:hypothetical protein H8356DRAFT_1327163 [Neocallimastix lanati (nom. inval.)]|nr:hypothetical protein H8356DRAFT_1327163 [Neocallimastix sp. JGI-2020a]